MPTAFDFVAAVKQALTDECSGAAEAVLERLTAPDALAAVSEIVHDMLVGPVGLKRMAAVEGVEEPLNSREEAGLVTTALAQHLCRRSEPLPPDEVLAAQVQALSYKDWRFSFVRRGDERSVRVLATVENAYRPDSSFSTSRTVTIERTVSEAALHAVLSIEEHEARERLFLHGKRVLSPHDPVRLPAARPD